MARRKAKKSQKGGSAIGIARKALSVANQVAKKTKAISRGLDAVGMKRTAKVARWAGYGKKGGSRSTIRNLQANRNLERHIDRVPGGYRGDARRVSREMNERRMNIHPATLNAFGAQQGGSFVGDVLGGLASIPGGLITGAVGGTIGALKGFGRQRGGFMFRTPRMLF